MSQKSRDNTSGLKLLSRETGSPAVDLGSLILPLVVLDHVREDVALRLEVLPLRSDAGNLFVAAADPNDTRALDEIAFTTGKRVVAYAAPRDLLLEAIEEAYSARKKGDIEWRGPKARGRREQGPLGASRAQKDSDPSEPVFLDQLSDRSIGAHLKTPEISPLLPSAPEPFAAEASYRATPSRRDVGA